MDYSKAASPRSPLPQHGLDSDSRSALDDSLESPLSAVITAFITMRTGLVKFISGIS